MIQESEFVDEIIDNNIISRFNLESTETEQYTFQHNGVLWSITKYCFNPNMKMILRISYSNLNDLCSNMMTTKQFYKKFIRKECNVYLHNTNEPLKKQKYIHRNGFGFDMFDIKLPKKKS
jgi:hypothetical protein